jgi:plasmid stabilization system protein ParE
LKTRLASPARRQADRIDRWWRENRPSTRDLFAREFDEARKRIAQTPTIGTAYLERQNTLILRVFLSKTKNHIYYEIDRDNGVVIILAGWGAPKGRVPKL